jgi:hypothetical protein
MGRSGREGSDTVPGIEFLDPRDAVFSGGAADVAGLNIDDHSIQRWTTTAGTFVTAVVGLDVPAATIRVRAYGVTLAEVQFADNALGLDQLCGFRVDTLDAADQVLGERDSRGYRP